MNHKDVVGVDIRVGDFVAYAASSGHSASLKFGKVLRLKQSKPWYEGDDREPEPKLGIRSIEHCFLRWEDKCQVYGWRLQNDGNETTIVLDHCIRVSGVSLSKEMLAELEKE